MRIPSFIGGTDEQRSNNISDNKLVNLYPVTNNDGSIAAFYKVDGLKSEGTLSGVPTGAYKASNGRAFYTSGTTLYELTVPGGVYTSTSRGTITTATNYEFSDNGLEMIMVNGTDGWVFTFETNSLSKLTLLTGNFTVQSATSVDVDATLTKTAHGLTIGDRVILTTTGALPTYLLPHVPYYVLADGFTSNAFKVGLTLTGSTFTVSIGADCVITSASHGFVAGDKVRFLTTGALPTGLTTGTIYYVLNDFLTIDTFMISAVPGGARITTSGTQSGTHSFNPAITIIQSASLSIVINDVFSRVVTIDSGIYSLARFTTTVDHGFVLGDIIQLSVSGGSLPSGMAITTNYYISSLNFSARTFGICTSSANIAYTTAGTGTITATNFSRITVSTTEPHNYSVGDIVYLGSSGVLPNGLSSTTPYYVSAGGVGTGTMVFNNENGYTNFGREHYVNGVLYSKADGSLNPQGHYSYDAGAKVRLYTTDGTFHPGFTEGQEYYVVYHDVLINATYVRYFCLSQTEGGAFIQSFENYIKPMYVIEEKKFCIATSKLDEHNTSASLIVAAATAQSGNHFIWDETVKAYGTHTYTTNSSGFPSGTKTISYMNGRFIACDPDTQDFYVSEVLDGKTWDAINVQTVDSNPDYVTGQIVANNELFVFCENSGETYYDSGTTPTPFVRNLTGIFEVGCKAPYTIKEIGGAVIFLGNTKSGNGIVYRMAGLTPVRISTYSIEYQIQQMSDISDARAFTYQKDGHHFYVLTFPTGNKTFVFDASTSLWHERSSSSSSTVINTITWSPTVSAETGFTVTGIAWNGTVFCAVGTGPVSTSITTCYTSTDGINWAARVVPSGAYQDVAWNGTVFCAVASSTGAPTTIAITSTDGITWTLRTLPTSATWNGIAWNGTVFCVISGINASSSAATSPDGITWKARTLPSSSGWKCIAWNGTVFCAIVTASTIAATSPDGITWEARTLSTTSSWQSIAWNGTVFCVISYNTSSVSMTSPDGITWTTRVLPEVSSWKDIESIDSAFFIINSVNNNTYTSTDGITWTISAISGTTGQYTRLCSNGTYLTTIGVTSPFISAKSNDVISQVVYSYAEWPVNKYLYYNNEHLTTDDTTTLFSVDSSTYKNGTNPIRIVRSFRAPPSDMKRVAHHLIQVDCEVGIGTGTEPVIALRWSDDAGNTWSTPIERGLGLVGDHAKSVIFRRLGSTKGIPRIYELSCDENVKITLLDCYLE